jgi:hypothetical protein
MPPRAGQRFLWSRQLLRSVRHLSGMLNRRRRWRVMGRPPSTPSEDGRPIGGRRAMANKKVLVLGGNFAGLTAALSVKHELVPRSGSSAPDATKLTAASPRLPIERVFESLAEAGADRRPSGRRHGIAHSGRSLPAGDTARTRSRSPSSQPPGIRRSLSGLATRVCSRAAPPNGPRALARAAPVPKSSGRRGFWRGRPSGRPTNGPAVGMCGQVRAVGARLAPGRHSGTVLGQRRSKTMRALTWPFSTSSKHSLTSSSLRVSRITRVRPWAWMA